MRELSEEYFDTVIDFIRKLVKNLVKNRWRFN